MVSISGKYLCTSPAISISLSYFSTKGFAPVRKVRVTFLSKKDRYIFFASFKSASIFSIGARTTAAVCNQLHPALVGANMLTIYPDSRLYGEIRQGNWKEETETEKYREVRALVEGLDGNTRLYKGYRNDIFYRCSRKSPV